jgi:hypothetical protein
MPNSGPSTDKFHTWLSGAWSDINKVWVASSEVLKCPQCSTITANPSAPVSRSTDKLDIFIMGLDGRIYTAAWEPDFGDWHVVSIARLHYGPRSFSPNLKWPIQKPDNGTLQSEYIYLVSSRSRRRVYNLATPRSGSLLATLCIDPLLILCG